MRHCSGIPHAETCFFIAYGAPGTDGLSDHVSQIIAALADRDLPAIHKIGVTSSAHEVDSSRGVLLRGDSRGLDHLLDRFVTSDCTLAVHYVGYAYQARGCPFWLIESLRRLRSLRDFRMISVFHELYASGPPWTSTFYVAHLQRLLFRALVSLSDNVATSTRVYMRVLEQQGKNPSTHPVISNVGEPVNPSELKQRANRAVVFGLPHSRRRLFESSTLQSVLQKLSVDEVLEIGVPCSQRPPNIAGVRWFQCGELSEKDVSESFLQSRFGLLNVFAEPPVQIWRVCRYSAHRMVPVLLSHPDSPVEELKPHVHYLDSFDMDSVETTPLQRIADECWRWYVNARSLDVCRELYVQWCRD